jgi:ABC-type multidrug transport system fused ATPase/permease subunit
MWKRFVPLMGFKTTRRALRIFSKTDRRKIRIITIVQIFLGILDLAGVAIIGILGALAISGIQSRAAGDRVQQILELLYIDGFTFQIQVAILGGLSAGTLVLRTILSVIFTRRILFFLSRKSAHISSNLVSRLFSQNLLEVQSKTSQEVLYAILAGVNTISLGIIGTLVTLATDLSLFMLMTMGLFIVDPLMAIGTFTIFGIAAFILYQLMNKRALEIGIQAAELSVKSNEMILEVLNSYREAIVRDRRSFYVAQIQRDRMTMANNSAEMAFMPNISKYVIEISVVVSAVSIAGFQFMTNEASRAVAILSIFLAATTRIAPAVLRVQQGALAMRGSIAAARPTLDLLQELGGERDEVETWREPDFMYKDFDPIIKIKDVSFRYPSRDKDVIKGVSLVIPKGSFVGFVGSSGAGKTTLIDLMLGVLEPKSGEVLISGYSPKDVVRTFPGAISYIPQDVVVVNGSIRKNVTLGYEEDFIPDEYIWDALRIAQLDEFVNELSDKLDSSVGDRGTKLSGGQRQRLGIARAMVTKPKLLVLDEATSAMDGELELNIGEAIQVMRGEVTIVMIAHRLSTIRSCDVIFHLSEGELTGSGNFEDLKALVPEFSRQALLMGL